MEALGGNSLWSDRFLGYHVAIGYYWILNVVFFFSPRIAYQFMELLEAHAVDTYGTFVVQNRERLAELLAVHKSDFAALLTRRCSTDPPNSLIDCAQVTGARRRDVLLQFGRPVSLRRLPGLDAAGDAAPGLRDLARRLHEYCD